MSALAEKRRILGDLGKATKRGVRKCPQCGTINGTRGMTCKNSLCDMVFKEILEKPRKVNLDACKLVTEEPANSCPWTTVFSIRVKDRCPDYLRGFVKIEFEDLSSRQRGVEEGNDATSNPILLQLESVELPPTRGTCYVIGCSKRCQPVKLDQLDQCCIHVLSCVSREDHTEAQPLLLKNSVLNSMNLSAESKQKLFLKAREGPLVQRVNAIAMVVRCEKDQLHPLGYLHTYFFKKNSSASPLATSPESPSTYKFGCSCHLSLPPLSSVSAVKKKSSASLVTLNQPEMYLSTTGVKDRCLHFYSCLAAFSGDAALSKIYHRFISDDYVVSSMQQVIAILDSEADTDGSSAAIKVIETADNLDLYKEELYANDFRIEMDEEEAESCSQTITLPAIAPDEILKRPLLGEVVKEKIFEMEAIIDNCSTPTDMSLQINANQGPAFTATDWLASITENINATMHYGFPTIPEPLIFHAPQAFFNFLMDRISGGSSQKKRLPNTTESFVRTVPPISRCTRYTWHLTNIFHLKKVFDTPTVSLEISRRFAKTNGSFSLIKSGEDYKSLAADMETASCKSRQKVLKPVEYKTFLKVGQMSTDPRDVTPFTIEWVPDLYPKTRVGELTIKFQFGHEN